MTGGMKITVGVGYWIGVINIQWERGLEAGGFVHHNFYLVVYEYSAAHILDVSKTKNTLAESKYVTQTSAHVSRYV